ncbi:helix-turn-helix domain-containing protein [Erwinia sp. V71]|uniref:helix-turn-helix domain-containing protein n=1 Tax=Erwinia sp. V71 TaxID=3369424 RepID=UPI003F646B98
MLLRHRHARYFIALLSLCLLHYLCAGLRELWPQALWAQLLPVSATALPFLCWQALRQACGQSPSLLWLVLPPALMALSVWQWPQAIDGLLLLTYFACAAAMLLRLREGENAFVAQSLGGVGMTLTSWRLMALMLIFCALIDLAVTADISLADGIWVQALLLLGQCVLCLFIALALVITPVEAIALDAPIKTASESDEQVMRKVELLMRDSMLYRETGLNLAMLARKSAIPARKVSTAINLLYRQRVSQYVNQWRIQEACYHLSHSSRPVLDIMEAVGFVTKSNFNREFLRITGKTPSQWRAEHAGEQSLS